MMSSANPKYAGELERDGGADGFGTRPAGSAQAPQYELFQWKPVLAIMVGFILNGLAFALSQIGNLSLAIGISIHVVGVCFFLLGYYMVVAAGRATDLREGKKPDQVEPTYFTSSTEP